MATLSLRDKPAAPRSSDSGGTTATARNTGLTIGLVLISRLLGVLRNILISHIFGQNANTDLFWAAFGVPDLIALVIAGGGLSSVFIPVFSAYWNADRDEDAWHVFGTVMSIVMVAIAIVVGLMEIGVIPLTAVLNHKFTAPQIAITAHVSSILLPAQWFLIVGAFMMGTLQARKLFLVFNLAPLLYNLGTICGALSQFHAMQPDVAKMAWGTLIGAFAGSFLLPLIELNRTGTKWRLGFDTRHEGVRRVGQLMVPVLLGLSLGQLIMWITQRCLPADDRITALKNAYDLTQAPIGIFAQAFAIVLLPTISDFAAQKRWIDFRKTISLGIRRVLFLTIPASLLMSVLALPLARLIYESGKFTDANAHTVATALQCYSLGTFAWSSLAILARGFIARQDTWTPVWITTPMVLVFYILVKIALWLNPDGIVGVALSASIVGALTMLLFLYFLQTRSGGLNMPAILRSLVRTVVAAGTGSGVAWGIAHWCERHLSDGRLGSACTLIVAGGVGIALYVGIHYLCHSPELRSIGEMFRKRPAAASAAK